MMKLRITLLLIITAFLTGCATTAYISSETDPSYGLSKESPIVVFVPDSSSIEERRIAALVADEMTKAGLNVVERDQADYVLVININQKTAQISGSLPVTQSANTYGSVGTTPYFGTTTYTSYIPYTENYTVKKLYAQLYAAKDIQQERFITVWEGYIGAEDVDFDKYTRSLVHELLKHFGGNYQRHTPIDMSYR